MPQLLANAQDSKKLEKAWALDQRALFHNDPDKKYAIWKESVGLCNQLLEKYKSASQDKHQILSKLALATRPRRQMSLAMCQDKTDM